MSTHILLMNLAAPGLALSAHAFSRAPIRASAKFLFVATAMQIAALWIAHSPPVVAASMQSFAIHVLIHAMLLASALSFWVSILSQDGTARWRAILALLATGKLFCLLAALLVFAPRALYPTHAGHGDQMVAAADLLSDQQLAGLLMLVICPLTYVFAGVLIAERWLSELRRRDAGIEPVR
jgi:putative membrane protein